MQLCYVAPRGPWKPSQPSMMQEPNSQFQGYAYPPQSNWNTPFPWQHWSSKSKNQYWKQGQKGTYGIHPQYPQYPPYPTPCYPYHPPPPQPQPKPHPSQISTPTQLPIPPTPNPQKEVAQPTYNAEVQHFLTSPLDLNGIHIKSRRVLQKGYSLDFIE